MLELRPGLDAGWLIDLGVVPEEALHRALDEDARQLVVDRPDLDEPGCRLILVGADVDDLGEVHQLIIPHQLEHVSGSWQAGEVGRITCGDGTLECTLQVAGGAHHDAVTGALLEWRDGRPEPVDLRPFPRSEDPDLGYRRRRRSGTLAGDQRDDHEDEGQQGPLRACRGHGPGARHRAGATGGIRMCSHRAPVVRCPLSPLHTATGPSPADADPVDTLVDVGQRVHGRGLDLAARQGHASLIHRRLASGTRSLLVARHERSRPQDAVSASRASTASSRSVGTLGPWSGRHGAEQRPLAQGIPERDLALQAGRQANSG